MIVRGEKAAERVREGRVLLAIQGLVLGARDQLHGPWT